MPSDRDKWIRSIKDNPAGKVIADPEGNRWQWDSNDETAHLLKKLNNDELAIEKTDIRPTPPLRNQKTEAAPAETPKARSHPLRSRAPDAGGGFNPYDNAGKPRRR
jgi:hypothetical protein